MTEGRLTAKRPSPRPKKAEKWPSSAIPKPVRRQYAPRKTQTFLAHEATFAAGDEETAERVFHSTVSNAAKLALQANVKQLYLTHISARYTEEEQRLMLERQAQTIFPASKVVGDFDVFDT